MSLLMKTKISLLFILGFFMTFVAVAQYQHYRFERKLPEASQGWHRIELPNAMFEHVKNDLSDVRIVGITAQKDTIEAPYFINFNEDKIISKSLDFQLINISQQGGKYFYTMKMSGDEAINEIILDFGQKNFDWKVKLEGSHNQLDWFVLLENYRILSIQNTFTDYQYSKMNLEAADFGYYRIQIESHVKPDLLSAKILLKKTIQGNYLRHIPKAVKIQEEEKSKTTQIDIDLGLKVPIYNLSLEVLDQFDYYRPMSIQFLSDSFHTEKGWKYSYSTIYSGTLSSLESSNFTFENTIAQKLRVLVRNQDNPALNFGTCTVEGYKYELIARLQEEADYCLLYGNAQARRPQYDIEHFKKNIPDELVLLYPEKEELIDTQSSMDKKPLFESKLWLWGVLILLIAILGYASLKMLKKE